MGGLLSWVTCYQGLTYCHVPHADQAHAGRQSAALRCCPDCPHQAVCLLLLLCGAQPCCKDSHHLHICCLFRIRHAPWIANMGDLVAMFSSVKVKGTGDFGRQSCYCHADVHVASGIPSPSMPLEDKLCTG